MIPVASGVRVWLAVGHTDMRRGMNSLAVQVQQGLERDPHAGDLYVFRGKRGPPTSFSIPIAICRGGVPVASASRSARSRLRPTGACRASDPLHRGPAGSVARDPGMDVRRCGVRSDHIGQSEDRGRCADRTPDCSRHPFGRAALRRIIDLIDSEGGFR